MAPKYVLLFLALSLPSAWTHKGLRAISRLKLDPLSKTRCDIVCQDVEKYNKASVSRIRMYKVQVRILSRTLLVDFVSCGM